MAKHSDKHRLLSRRAFVFGSAAGAGMTALAGRLYYLQFIRSDEYSTLSENNRVKLQLLAPERGHIIDRMGQALASNEKNYQLFLDATGLKRKQVAELIAKAGGIIQLNERHVTKAMDELRVNPYASPLLVKEHLSWEEVATFELHQLGLSGMYIDIGQVRYYPFAQHAAHLIGYVGAVSPEELEAEGKPPILRIPGFKIGKSGVEKIYEERMRGTAGIKQLEVNVHGQPVRELETKDSIAGETIHLTIDARLQEYAAERVKDESAAVLVMDVTNGDVLTFVSMPGYDPNIFSKGIPTEYWKELHDNIRDPLVNKATQGQYPPGSTFKMLVGMAGLMEGKFRADEHVFCPGHFYLGNHRFNCWKEGGHGSVNIVSAIAVSCDTYFYTVAQRIGIDAIAKVARMFGLGSGKLLGFPSEKSGLIPDTEWKMKRYKQRWTTGDSVNAGIGQGYVLATPLQLAVMTARLATGKEVMPRLVNDGTVPVFKDLDIPPEILEYAHRGMDAVTNSGMGTAYGKRIAEPKYAMAGKTGTSQVRKILQRGMKQELLPWEYRHHALFVGYAPVTNPKYACAVLIEHGGGGSSAAAPVARDVLLKVQQLADGDKNGVPYEPAVFKLGEEELQSGAPPEKPVEAGGGDR